ncbi:aminotransferase [Actinoplanes ianthinogenes]|uniref:Aminotransferase n=1 Tax=Actinoplanes ianthinogenes TaxID=122358 RepID=A0ABM7M8Y0_9ACTN|nr:PLP-dependent aminotransferase family protein [Actinoplanes ianthinogenes]BCJ48081.1 aminotransferase [Actinoplanes ianthinogenes]GGR06274.1 aminotransferase [Actinoplanes ianthinogenes]
MPSQRLAAVVSSPVRDLLALIDRPDVISFAGGLPAPELFDLANWRTAFDTALSGPHARRHLQYAPTEGDPRLRAAAAARMTARGLPTAADQLLITTGSQQALTLVAAALLDPGAVVAVDQPTYLAALQCFGMAGARIVPVTPDDPDTLARVFTRERPTLLYLVPTFANPTGRTLDAHRRAAIVALAQRHGVWIVEDDPYGELRYRGEHLTPMAAAGDRVIHLGSLSKIGAPGLRLGWLRAPAPLRAALIVAKQAADLHTSTIDQAAAAAYLDATDLDAHIDRLRDAYRERRDTMLAALPEIMPDGATWTDPDGGMFVWVRLPGGADTAQLLPVALEHDVAFVPGAPFYAADPDPATLRLSFTAATPAVIREGMRRLGKALTAG